MGIHTDPGIVLSLVIIGGMVFLLIVGPSIANQIATSRLPLHHEPARVVTKRTRTSSAGTNGRVTTGYYVTFEVATGERREFTVRDEEYGLLDDDDTGILTTQGPRYHGFVRDQP